MRLLDLFCGAGGCSVGYHRAGFEVVGVDLHPQPNYPYEFHQGDALDALLNPWLFTGRRIEEFDAIHASPPCQAHSRMSACRPGLAETYPELIAPTRELLDATGLPYVIENVPGAPLRKDIVLCGCQFGLRSPRGLGVRRERWFETNWSGPLMVPPHDHSEPALPVTGHSPGKEWRIRMAHFGAAPGIEERRVAMEVEWMNREEASEAIPPAYTEFIGSALMAHLRTEASPADPASHQGVATCPAASSSSSRASS